MTQANTALEGFRLLVVEDEALVAMLLKTMLVSLGCAVVDIVGSVAQALERIEQLAAGADAAILDVNLGGQRVYPVADELDRRGVPFLFATGYGPLGIGDLYPGRIVLAKPYTKSMLTRALLRLRAQGGAEG